MRPQHLHDLVHPSNTYFVTANAWEKRSAFQTDRMKALWLDVLYAYRAQGKYLLHEFVLMPDHFHAVLTPKDVEIGRALQVIKGGLSYRAKKELGYKGEVWQQGFTDRRVRDASDYQGHRIYIHTNPVKRGLVQRLEDYYASSANPRFELDLPPEHLRG